MSTIEWWTLGSKEDMLLDTKSELTKLHPALGLSYITPEQFISLYILFNTAIDNVWYEQAKEIVYEKLQMVFFENGFGSGEEEQYELVVILWWYQIFKEKWYGITAYLAASRLKTQMYVEKIFSN